MIFSSSLYLTVNVPYVQLLPEYRPQLDVSLPPKTIRNSWHVAYCDPKFLACCILPESLPQFDFGVSMSSPEDKNTNYFKWPYK
jgi:hypothetical protein